jgi:hypothetical protein
LVGVVILGLAGAGGWFAWRHDLWRPAHWRPGDHPYKPACTAGDCKTLGPIAADSGDGGKPMAVLGYDPAVDDEIAQWGDCLQSVTVCVEATAGPPETVLGPCVERAACPAACKSHFAGRTAGLKGRALLDAYLAIFAGDDGYCTPRGA